MLNYSELEQPETFLTQRSLDRRKQQGTKLDSIDLPVTQAYLDNLPDSGITVRYVSKWLNGAVITVFDANLAYRLKIKFFVDDVVYLGTTKASQKSGIKTAQQTDKNSYVYQGFEPSTSNPKADYGASYTQIDMLNGLQLHEKGLKGEGIWIAVFDAGFYKVNELSAFGYLMRDHLKATFDLVDGGTNVFDDNDHGMNVLGLMAASLPGTIIGTAPEADYLLFRTESKSYENLLEELNWVRAAEMADSLGVDIINSSLGYNTFDEKRLNHDHSQLDGKTSFISRGANMAASRGILVVNASGNDGNKSWKKINFPADAEGILSVGAVTTDRNPPSFSSYGPTADFRIKPEVSALGYQTTITTTYGTAKANGTSFSCPIVAGMMACLWQADRTATPEKLISVISRSGHLVTDPDNVLGYGVPNFQLALTMLGADKHFDYNITGPVNGFNDSLKSGDILTAFVKGGGNIVIEIRSTKRFLLFKYQKTNSSKSFAVLEDGFIRFSANTSNVKNGKMATIYIYKASGKQRKEGKSLFSHPFRSI